MVSHFCSLKIIPTINIYLTLFLFSYGKYSPKSKFRPVSACNPKTFCSLRKPSSYVRLPSETLICGSTSYISRYDNLDQGRWTKTMKTWMQQIVCEFLRMDSHFTCYFCFCLNKIRLPLGASRVKNILHIKVQVAFFNSHHL